jgi:hypothetical protein
MIARITRPPPAAIKETVDDGDFDLHLTLCLSTAKNLAWSGEKIELNKQQLIKCSYKYKSF